MDYMSRLLDLMLQKGMMPELHVTTDPFAKSLRWVLTWREGREIKSYAMMTDPRLETTTHDIRVFALQMMERLGV